MKLVKSTILIAGLSSQVLFAYTPVSVMDEIEVAEESLIPSFSDPHNPNVPSKNEAIIVGVFAGLSVLAGGIGLGVIANRLGLFDNCCQPSSDYEQV